MKGELRAYLLGVCCYIDAKDVEGDRVACLEVMLTGNAAIICGTAETMRHAYQEKWTFATMDQAIDAFHVWTGKGEPQGWIRHIPSNRRRERGDPKLETIRA